ncbi:hypothetical protein C0Q70_16289 [Pomacea canaliculata]|uniref:Uncharacterized protein n=1 Tax=Pomacea canaliculata TaxID=400727 RepID=A0A2T7NPD3_POMCA|nr:hypothetical protein C0Q70_16289 [Pomacea canaliculata]
MPSDAEWARPGGARDGTATANAGLESSPSSERGRDGGYIGRDTRWQDYTAPPFSFSLPSPPPDASERDGRGQARRLAFQTREPLVGPLQSLSRARQHDDRQAKWSPLTPMVPANVTVTSQSRPRHFGSQSFVTIRLAPSDVAQSCEA